VADLRSNGGPLLSQGGAMAPQKNF